jgi:hypothetical protein
MVSSLCMTAVSASFGFTDGNQATIEGGQLRVATNRRKRAPVKLGADPGASSPTMRRPRMEPLSRLSGVTPASLAISRPGQPAQLKTHSERTGVSVACARRAHQDEASGTQLIQVLLVEGLSAVTRYMPEHDKIMRLYAQTATIENGFVYLPSEAPWLADYLHELTTFP